jgi:hypothetical protein
MTLLLDQTESAISAAIKATLERRRASSDPQSPAWRALCEAAYVAALSEQHRSDYLSLIKEHRGADAAASLASDATVIRLKVVDYLKRKSTS